MSNSEALDFRAASEFFSEVPRPLNDAKRITLGLVVNRGSQAVLTLHSRSYNLSSQEHLTRKILWGISR
jgi:hypothetical protein